MTHYLKLLARKIKTTNHIDNDGNLIPVTIIELYQHYFFDILYKNTNDEIEIKLSAKFLRATKNKVTKSIICEFEKRHLLPMKHILVGKINKSILQKLCEKGFLRERYNLTRFTFLNNLFDVEFKGLDIIAKSKGLGFTGTIKRHGFKQGPKTHGSKSRRRPGSIGAGTTPGRVLERKKMAGHSGYKNITVKNVRLVSRDRLILSVKNTIPGKNNSDIFVKIKL